MMQIEYVPIETLKTMPGNPRRNDDAIGPVADSIKRFGWTNPILARKQDGVVIAGHTRLEAAQMLGLAEVPVIYLDMNDVDSKLYNLADNKLSQIASWDQPLLAAMLEALKEEDAAGLAIAGFGEDELKRILAEASATNEGLTDPDEVPEDPEKVYVQKGDIYTLGHHLIACGDCLDPSIIARMHAEPKPFAAMCWTDPPWNVALGARKRTLHHAKREEITNDNLGEAFPGFCAAFCGVVNQVLLPGAPIYLVMSTSEWPAIDQALRGSGFHWSSTIAWAKESFVLGMKDYHSQFEPIWYGWKEGAPRLTQVADRKQSDLWAIDRPKKSAEHPTMKPVELVARAIKNSSKAGDSIFEPFSGSGTTIIAAEMTGRDCRAIELEPKYVQVAIERWEKFTGKKAKKA